MRNEEKQQLMLPKNIRQIGTFGDTYKIYVEDFVYTYVHQFLHRRKKEGTVLAAVLLGKTYTKENQEYVFISGAQKVDFQVADDTDGGSADRGEVERTSPVTDAITNKQQDFWNRVYQGIKEYFDDQEIIGWYFNLDGGNLQINAELQQFFESTYKKGSRFLYFEDALEKEDAFFVQEQHKLQRISGYAVYYEKNPAMQEFMIAEKEKATPKPLREKYVAENNADDVAQNYRAIMNKLNEKPPKRKGRPVIYVAGVAVLAVVVATGITQIGSYQNLKVLEQTMQTLSGAVNRDRTNEAAVTEDSKIDSTAEDTLKQQTEKPSDTAAIQEAPSAPSGTTVSEAASSGADVGSGDNSAAAGRSDGSGASTTSDSTGSPQDSAASADTDRLAAAGTDSAASDGTSAGSDHTSSVTTDQPGDDGTKQQNASGSGNAVSAEKPASAALPDYYIVKKGDSLVTISNSLYNTTEKIDEICELNGIENMDVIYVGQKLILPK